MSPPPTEPGAQEDVVEFLRTPGVIAPAGEPVAEIETHVSHVFLAGGRVLKLKRAVHLPYLDFSTVERRRAACEAEVAINRRTAPDLYEGVVAVTREAGGGLALAGVGTPVDWMVEMRRFAEESLFDKRAVNGELRRVHMDDLADRIAAFHADAPARPSAGGSAGIRMIVENNAACLEAVADEVLDRAAVERLNAESLAAVEALADALEARRAAGAVRHCHGDLHLRNICVFDGRPTLFDAIEFNIDFAEIDVLYDLAFVLMDLDHRGHARLAGILFNRYLDVTGEVAERPGALAVMPLFLSMRAAVRAHVDATQALTLADPEKRRRRAGEAGAYLDLALRYLCSDAPRLVAVGGLSGSGKSRLARELAPYLGTHPAARVVRTDAVRKRLAGVGQETRLGPDGYTADMHERTYAAFYREIEAGLAQGAPVIADAVFPHPDQRAAVAAVAADAGVAFQGIWVEAPREVIEKRVRERQRNISDATVEIVRQQLSYDLGVIDWARVDSSGERDETVAAGRRVLGLD
ncbi:MAG: AAA family ATPase [Magnetovibrio sp.]|nr:AAA family ATPase [Magnetovibrio sp.]